MKEAHRRDNLAFWLFGMSNSFAFIVLLTAGKDIMTDRHSSLNDRINSSLSEEQCDPFIEKRECKVQPLGILLLANIIPAFFIKSLVPFGMHRLPFSLLHILVCLCQALSYLIVSTSSSIQWSLVGVVFSAIGTGLGDVCYLALASHYHRDSIAWWASGTGGSGILASSIYAILTESNLGGMSPNHALLLMLVVPCEFLLAYFLILTPAPTVYSASLLAPNTWVVPRRRLHHSLSYKQRDLIGRSDLGYIKVGDSEMEPKGQEVRVTVDEAVRMTAGERVRIVLTLLKYIVPLTAVYFFDFVINQGLATFMIFDCSHGFGLSAVSQYRWLQVLYCCGSFLARSSTQFFRLPYVFLVISPVFESLNALFFLSNALYLFVGQIWMIFALIFIQGLISGATYANTYYRIHKEVDPKTKEFALAITTMSDVVGIMLAGLCTLPIHSFVCGHYARN